jgi:hypothetical protein
MNLFGDILSRAKQRVDGWNGTLYLVYLPSWKRYANNDDGTVDKERAGILALARSIGIPSLDLHPTFQAHADPLSLFPFRRFYHYNEQGHQIVAEEVLKAISVLLNTQQPAHSFSKRFAHRALRTTANC